MKIIFVLSVLLFLAATIQPHPQCPSFWRGSRRSRQGPLQTPRPTTQRHIWSVCYPDEPDGCSNLYLGRWENTFTSSCDKHDMCYICGGGRHYDWSRKFCDDAFKHDMRKACSKVRKGNWWSNPRRDCYDWSNIYYRAVRIGGHLSYNKKYCSDSCIKSRGDPGRRITL